MAQPTSKEKNSNMSNPYGGIGKWGHEEEDTAMAGQNREKMQREEQEILVKWQLPGNHDSVSAKKLLTRLIAELLMCFPDVTFVDHKHREWSFTAADTEEKFQKEIEKSATQTHSIKTKQQRIIRWIAITKIRSVTGISDWKSNDHFYDQVIEEKTYMFPHPFQYDEWDITSIGFIKDIHAVHFTQEYLHKTITDHIIVQEPNPPIFQLIPQKITNKDKTATTRAYTVQCTKAEAKRMGNLLTQGEFRRTQMFIPFRYKTSQPELFTNCIKQQNEVYYKTWIIKVEGISNEIMHFIQGEISKLNGVFHVVPSNRYKERGEWKILVDQDRSSFIHRQLQTQWSQIISDVPGNFLKHTPASWSTPRISSKKIRSYQDDSSANDSYGSLLTSGTSESLMTYGDESLNELPAEYQYQSYADAAAPPPKAVTATSTSSHTTSELTEWQKEKNELETQLKTQAKLFAQFQAEQEKMIKSIQETQAFQIEQLKAEQALQIEKLQAEIQGKVSRSQDLEENLAQAIELAYTRNNREDEMLRKIEMREAEMFQKFEAMMNQFTPDSDSGKPTAMDITNQLVSYGKQHTTPPRANTSKDSPPPKKANTNASPQRNIYSMFRPPTGKVARPAQKNSKSPPRLLTQPMESEDEQTMPAPVANLGKKFEWVIILKYSPYSTNWNPCISATLKNQAIISATYLTKQPRKIPLGCISKTSMD